MKKLLFILSLALITLPTAIYAQQSEKSLDEKINDLIAPATEVVSDIVFFSLPITDDTSIPFVLIWLVLGAVIFTVYM